MDDESNEHDVVAKEPGLSIEGKEVADRDSEVTEVSLNNNNKRVAEESDLDGQVKTPKKGRFQLEHILPSKDAGKWELEGELTDFFHYYCTKYVSEKDLDEIVGDKYPFPSNLKGTPELNSQMEARLKRDGDGVFVDRDSDLSKISKKILAVMGPLGAAWSAIELWRNGEAKEDIDIDEIADQVQKSVILLGQAENRIRGDFPSWQKLVMPRRHEPSCEMMQLRTRS